MKPFIFVSFPFLLCANFSFATASIPSDYCQTRTVENNVLSDVKGGITTGFGYAVYCGNDIRPNELSRSVKAFLPSNSKASQLATETNEKLEAMGYHQVISYAETGFNFNLKAIEGVFVKESASLRVDESLCLIRRRIASYNDVRLVCTPGAKVFKNIVGEDSSLESVLAANGYTEVAPSIYRK